MQAAGRSTRLQQLCQRLGHAGVFVREKCRGKALLAGAAGTADAVHIVVDICGQVKVDDVRDVRDVQAARRDIGCHQDWCATRAEAAQRLDAAGQGLCLILAQDQAGPLLLGERPRVCNFEETRCRALTR